MCGGNSDGQPCASSFTYDNKTFTGCTRYGRRDNELWCSTTQNYDDDKKWGFCICGNIRHGDRKSEDVFTNGVRCVQAFVVVMLAIAVNSVRKC